MAWRECFNPRARDGRENEAYQAYKAAKVSIHAPVMDANPDIAEKVINHAVSIHAPVMDAKSLEWSLVASNRFQSTRP